MKYTSKNDIYIAIQCLKVITEKKINAEVKRKVNPSLLRVIMELEDIAR